MTTNIEHNGECPDCKYFERRIDTLNGKLQEADNESASLKAENNRLREALKDIERWSEYKDNHDDILYSFQQIHKYAKHVLSQPKEETK